MVGCPPFRQFRGITESVDSYFIFDLEPAGRVIAVMWDTGNDCAEVYG